ncbi:hypothetical protein A2U01_0111582, partial [Trifolium medium]|nr:hypothetical protein [Trifolium medium]
RLIYAIPEEPKESRQGFKFLCVGLDVQTSLSQLQELFPVPLSCSLRKILSQKLSLKILPRELLISSFH